MVDKQRQMGSWDSAMSESARNEEGWNDDSSFLIVAGNVLQHHLQ